VLGEHLARLRPGGVRPRPAGDGLALGYELETVSRGARASAEDLDSLLPARLRELLLGRMDLRLPEFGQTVQAVIEDLLPPRARAAAGVHAPTVGAPWGGLRLLLMTSGLGLRGMLRSYSARHGNPNHSRHAGPFSPSGSMPLVGEVVNGSHCQSSAPAQPSRVSRSIASMKLGPSTWP
jgi:hypothetical protein